MNKLLISVFSIAILLLTLPLSMSAQKNISSIWALMERRDLNIQEIDAWAKTYFDQNGTGRGTGYKQFQRWRYDLKFHLDKNGFMIPPEDEFRAYQQAFPTGRAASRNLLGAWTEIGPFFKNATSGWNPGQGRVSGIAIHPSDQTVMYISSPGGGIWKSTNSGAAWSSKIDNVNSAWMNVYHICIAPNDQTVLFAGLTEGGVIKSTNSGDTWAATGTGPSKIRKILVHPTNKLIVLAAAQNGIWRSVDGGAIWENTSTPDAQDIEFKANDPQVMLASGLSSNLRRSTDNGETWSDVALPAGSTSDRTMIGVTAANANIVYVIQGDGKKFGKLHKSTDAGLMFTTQITGDSASGTNYFGYETNGKDNDGQAHYCMAIAVHPTNADEVHIGGIICWKSTNGGTSFTATTQWKWPAPAGNYNHADVHQLEWVGSTLYAGSDGGLYRSTNNGTTWTDLSQGYGTRQFYRIATSKTVANVIAGGLQDQGSVFRQNGMTWVEWLGADGMDCVIDPNNATTAIGTSQNGDIYKTIDNAQMKTDLTKPNEGNWVTPLVWHPTHSDTIYGGWKGFYRSNNGGTTWNLLGAETAEMNCIAIAPSNTQYLYASNAASFRRSKDGGVTWETPDAPNSLPANIASIAVSPLNPEKIWVATTAAGANVWVSTNAGTTWTDISAGLPTIAASSIVVDNNAAEDLYLGMNIGVYTRSNVNTTWTQQATGLPLVSVREVEIQKISNKLFVATYGRGIWESALTATILPVTLTTFKAKANGEINDLTWQVADQSGIQQYKIERSEDGLQDWQAIGAVEAQKSQAADYQFSDKQPLPIAYYRLKIEEVDGTTYYSKVVVVDRQKSKLGIAQLFPNPVEKTLQVSFDAPKNGSVSVVVRDLIGRVLMTQKVDCQEGRNNLTLNVNHLPSATYFLLVSDGKEQKMEKFVKQ